MRRRRTPTRCSRASGGPAPGRRTKADRPGERAATMTPRSSQEVIMTCATETVSKRRPSETLAAALAIAALLAVGTGIGAARAADRDHHDRRWEHHDRHWDGGYYRAPPVVYGPAPGYYAPPPVVYSPGISVGLPGINVNIR